jgi:hypothetical protein
MNKIGRGLSFPWLTRVGCRTTDEGKALLRRTLLLQRYFERKEDNKDCFAEGEFHAKCLVDDLLFNFLVDPPGNTRG